MNQAAVAAVAGMEATKLMPGQAGRSNYVNEELMRGTPDPGAFVVSTIFSTLADL